MPTDLNQNFDPVMPDTEDENDVIPTERYMRKKYRMPSRSIAAIQKKVLNSKKSTQEEITKSETSNGYFYPMLIAGIILVVLLIIFIIWATRKKDDGVPNVKRAIHPYYNIPPQNNMPPRQNYNYQPQTAAVPKQQSDRLTPEQLMQSQKTKQKSNSVEAKKVKFAPTTESELDNIINQTNNNLDESAPQDDNSSDNTPTDVEKQLQTNLVASLEEDMSFEEDEINPTV